jgi:small-conductance mechanosensitive channel
MKAIFNYTILEIVDYSLRVSAIAELILLISFIFLLLAILKKLLFKTNRIDSSRKYSVYRLFKYFIVVITFVLSLRIAGIDVTVLLASFAALLVGIGLGLQNLFSDYMSGIIILFDSSVKVNDIIEVKGTVGRVINIGLRTTTVFTRDDRYIILPNTNLTGSELINWTLQEIASRFEISIGVDYLSDVHLVMKVLNEIASKHTGVLKQPEPFVRFNEFGDSALLFTLYFWADEVFRVENIKSTLRIQIFEAFKANKIILPFPQRVCHIKKEV